MEGSLQPATGLLQRVPHGLSRPMPPGDGAAGPDARGAILQAVLENAVIPTLAAGLRRDRPDRWARTPPTAWATRAEAASRAVAGLDLAEAVAALRGLNPGGRWFERLCRDVLLPAAVRLREEHDPDALDRSLLLLGLWRLRLCVLGLDDALENGGGPAPAAGSVVVVPGATGLPSPEGALSLRFFRRVGWEVHDCRCGAEDEACDALHDDGYDVAWLGLEPAPSPEAVRRTAAHLRDASRNRRLLVLGGGCRAPHRTAAGALGLDGFAANPCDAASLASERLGRTGDQPERAWATEG